MKDNTSSTNPLHETENEIPGNCKFTRDLKRTTQRSGTVIPSTCGQTVRVGATSLLILQRDPGWTEIRGERATEPIRSCFPFGAECILAVEQTILRRSYIHFICFKTTQNYLYFNMPSLGYWKIRGLAQPMRLLLNYVGEDFEDVQYEQGDAPDYSREAWLKVKSTLGLDFPNLPYYIDGDIKITQSNAILRYIARKHDLLGKTEKERVNVDMMLENAMDFRNGVVRMVYNPDYERLIKDYEPRCKEILAGFEKWLSNKTWFAGDNVTVADFPMYELLDQHRLMIPGILDNYPKLSDFMKRFEALPPIKAYMASDKFMSRPINNKVAKFK